MGVGAGLYMYDVVVKGSRSLSHLLISSCTNGRRKTFSSWNLHCALTLTSHHYEFAFKLEFHSRSFIIGLHQTFLPLLFYSYVCEVSLSWNGMFVQCCRRARVGRARQQQEETHWTKTTSQHVHFRKRRHVPFTQRKFPFHAAICYPLRKIQQWKMKIHFDTSM